MNNGSESLVEERGSITSEAAESKTLFIGSLDLSIDEEHVRDFFKGAGEVDEVRFVMENDKFEGYCHVEFTTVEAAQKALKLNNELLLDRPVKVDWLKERGSSNPITPQAPESRTLMKVDSAPDVVAPSIQTMNNGKRGAEEVVEMEVVGSKKQRIANADVEQVVVETKCEAETPKENDKKEETNSSKESSFSEYEEGHKKATQDAKKASATNDESEEDDGDDRSVEEDDDQPSKSPKKNDTDVEMVDSPLKTTPQTLVHPQEAGSKTLFMGNLSFQIEEDDLRDFFKDVGEIAEIRFAMRDDRFLGYGHVEFTTIEAVREALKLNNMVILDRRVKLELLRREKGSSNPRTSQPTGSRASAEEKGPFTPMTPQAPGSRTLFIGNLNYWIQEGDVRNFFKDVGEVDEIRFVFRDDKFTGYGHVDFATPEEAQKAIKLNNQILLDRPVKLDFAKERGANVQIGKENQKGGQAHGLTVYVRGFDVSKGFENVRSTLEGHFGKCGEISRVSIPKDYESGGPKGVAFIDFMDSKGFYNALELNGCEVKGGVLTVEEAKKSRGDGRDGGRGGGRGRFSGGRDGGRGRAYGGRSGWT